jgi:hypothetical protein
MTIAGPVSRGIRVIIVVLVLLAAACSETSGQNLERDDFLGDWDSLTTNGRARLTFEYTGGLYRYVFSAPGGDFGNIALNPGSDILSRGIWGLSGSVITLFDEEGFPLSCPVSDRFDVLMSSDRDTFILTFIGDDVEGCLTRAQILEGTGWSLQVSAS